MCAREHIQGDVICTYSDIWVEAYVYSQLTSASGDIVAAVDIDWQPYYEGRTDHPLGEAENVFFDYLSATHTIYFRQFNFYLFSSVRDLTKTCNF